MYVYNFWRSFKWVTELFGLPVFVIMFRVLSRFPIFRMFCIYFRTCQWEREGRERVGEQCRMYFKASRHANAKCTQTTRSVRWVALESGHSSSSRSILIFVIISSMQNINGKATGNWFTCRQTAVLLHFGLDREIPCKKMEWALIEHVKF